MATSVTFNGTSYSIPAAGELNWSALSNFLIDVGNNAQTTTFSKQATRIATSTPVTVSAATDVNVNVNIASAATVDLPAGSAGQMFRITDSSGAAATNNITIDANGAETINGATTYVINTNNGGVTLAWNGSEWRVIGQVTLGYFGTNVGLGTSVPTSQAHIKSDAANDVNSGLLFEAAGNTDKLFRIYQESDAVDTRVRAEMFFADALTHAFDTGGNSYINTGNFGLGTPSPGRKLEIHSSAPQIRIGESSTRYAEIQGQSSGAGSEAQILFKTTDSGGTSQTRMIIEAGTGSFGFGGTSITPGVLANFGDTSPAISTAVASTGRVHIMRDTGNIGLIMGSNTGDSGNDFYVEMSPFSSGFDIRASNTTTIGAGVRLTSGATTWGTTSDIRYKEITEHLTDALPKIDSLSTVKYHFKSDLEKSIKVGIIAQEVMEILPEVVDYGKEDDMYTVRYTELLPLVIKAIQELNEKIEGLKK